MDYRVLKQDRLAHDGYRCSLDPIVVDGKPKTLGCGQPVSYHTSHLHHVAGRGMAGSKRDDTLDSTRSLCFSCHRRVTPRPWGQTHRVFRNYSLEQTTGP